MNCFSGCGNDHNEINPCICSTSHIIARLRTVISSRLMVSFVILSHSAVKCAGSRPHRHNVTALSLKRKPHTHCTQSVIKSWLKKKLEHGCAVVQSASGVDRVSREFVLWSDPLTRRVLCVFFDARSQLLIIRSVWLSNVPSLSFQKMVGLSTLFLS